MDILWRVTDYLMDFNKVRAFQDLCGLRESEENLPTGKSKNTDDHSNMLYDEFEPRDSTLRQVNQSKKHISSCGKAENASCPNLPERVSEQKTYNVKNWFLYCLFRFGSTLGHEVFYITFIPCIFWNLDPFIGRKMIVVWVVTMYIGQALKDLIKWPRPTWPPVFKLETRVEAEYGIPSTHAIAGTALPFSFLMAMYGRYEFPLEIGIILACSWCLLVALSRLYVGMHSILDVITGVTLTAIYLWLGWPFMDMVEIYAMTSTFAPWLIVMSHFLLGVFYPSTDRYTTTRGDTVIILAVGAGSNCVTHWHYQYGYNFGPSGNVPFLLTFPTLSSLGISLARAVIGILITVLTRQVMKAASLTLVCQAVGVSKNDRLARQRKDVEVTYKFVTYTVVSFVALGMVPILLQQLGLVHS
uniref:Sphingosine-1-phosphate phosphatase 2 n=1 Tax=Phallusia mammillata TaxID=59560 RepID=A0A6F9DRG1_9ASCI|nr:sphingosine-1-phosphate phosphatase 2 [Phallusia mammillata]